MKVGLAIAPAQATPLAFVVFRGDLSVIIKKVAELGYDGIELALKDSREVEIAALKNLISGYDLKLPVVSSGRVFSEAQLFFTHSDKNIRHKAIDTVKGLIELAAHFRANVNIGRVRGYIADNENEAVVKKRFFSAMRECADFAYGHGVSLLLEPVNRYEINFVNSVTEGIHVLQQIGRENVKLMPDLFHMNIEDASIVKSLRQAGPRIGYMHFADSNRWAPGQGHLNFPEVINTLKNIGYDDFVTLEILPKPDPDSAARMGLHYLRSLL